ncbi:Uncharacterised protein [Pantoea agglomerans]|uniref:Uncharacterized protein n=1 Tax=Enterobacter agglomerans TaxID=549 RepID=A0A379AEE7_ENTAG|nr:Uncharacterised protein [Pantoea agglomerans]
MESSLITSMGALVLGGGGSSTVLETVIGGNCVNRNQ